jgi:hypothetical protein
MSGSDNKAVRDSEQPEQEDLMDELESIRELLDEEREEQHREAGVPLLDDLVDGALTLDEKDLSATQETLTENRSAADRLDDEFLASLLTDEWKVSASDLFTQARGAIEAHRNEWTPEDTDELNDALRERIDATLTRWLQDTLRTHLHELKAELLQAAEATLNERIALLTEQGRSLDESDQDG